MTETPLTGDDLAEVTAGVQARLLGAAIDRSQTDADGTKATVKFEASANVAVSSPGWPDRSTTPRLCDRARVSMRGPGRLGVMAASG